MPKQELTEEQKQVKRIANKWNQTQFRSIYVLIGSALLALLFLQFLPFTPALGIFASLLIFGTPIGAIIYAIRFSRKYIRNMTSEEVALLESAADMGEMDHFIKRTSATGTKHTANLMLTQRRRLVKTPQNELLRASKPTDDGTLLRPTTGNAETRKEELLRASEERQ